MVAEKVRDYRGLDTMRLKGLRGQRRDRLWGAAHAHSVYAVGSSPQERQHWGEL